MDSEIREKLEGLEVRVARLETVHRLSTLTPQDIRSMRQTILKSLLFWLATVVILAAIWLMVAR